MALEKEIWQGDIVAALWPANPHLLACFNADQHVLQGKVVHIPNAGAAPVVERNRATLPAAVNRRTDNDVTYPLDEFTADPVLITDAEKVELSYDKRNSVLLETKSALAESTGVMMLYNWAPSKAARVIRTSGAAIDASMPDATGKRKNFALADFKKAQKQFNQDNVPGEGRYAIFSAEMMDQLTTAMSATEHRDFVTGYDATTGVVGKLFGFNILVRSTVLAFDNATGKFKMPGTDGAAGDCDTVLCWHRDSVERALGEVKVFDNPADATYYGDICSALVRMGGRVRRADEKGVVAIAQAPSA